MTDTLRLKSTLLTSLFQDGQAPSSITPQDLRDLIVSIHSPMMGIYFSSSAQTNVAVAGTYLKAAGTTTITNQMGDMDDDSGTSNRIRYTGATLKHFHLVCQASITLSGGSGQNSGIQIWHYDASAAAGSLVVHSEAQSTQGSSAIRQITTHGDVLMDTNDYLELWVTNNTSASNDPTVSLGYLFAVGMLM